MESVTRIVDATNSVNDQVADDDPMELIPQSPRIDAEVFEVKSSTCSLGSYPRCPGIVFLPAGISISLTFVVLPEIITELHFNFLEKQKRRNIGEDDMRERGRAREKRGEERRGEEKRREERSILCVMEGQLSRERVTLPNGC